MSLSREGLTQREISVRTGVPLGTVRNWQRGRNRSAPPKPRRRRRPPVPDLLTLPTPDYPYLLGFYLGDGCLSRQSNGSWCLRIVSDASYPALLREAQAAMESVSGGTAWQRKRAGQHAFELGLTWWHWPLVFPQHGPGRKHSRRIVLADWQRNLIEQDPRPFLRGLIHSDGWRPQSRTRQRQGLRLSALSVLEPVSGHQGPVHLGLRPDGDRVAAMGAHHISVARRGSVAKLDEFIGAKR